MKKPIIGLSILILLIGQVVLINLINLFVLPISSNEALVLEINAHLKYFSTTISYISIAILLATEINSITDFNLDGISLLLLVLFGPFLWLKPNIQAQCGYRLIIIICCLVILYLLIKNWSRIPKTDISIKTFKSFSIVGIVLAFVVVLEILQFNVSNIPQDEELKPLLNIFQRTVYNLASTSTVEEIIFRCFLWGYLKRFGFSEKKSLWIQAFIFWIIHYPRMLISPISFFLTLPILTMLYSQITLKTRQIFYAIVTHTIANSLVPVLVLAYFSYY